MPIKQGYETDAEDKAAKEACDTLARNSCLDEKLVGVGFCVDVYGHGALENVFWGNGGGVVSVDDAFVDIVPSSTIDWVRDTQGKIVFSGGRPTGFTQTTGASREKRTLPLERIAFTWYNPLNEFEPVSLIDTLYQTVTRLSNAYEGYAEWVHKKGFPFYIAKVGTPERPATDTEFDAVESAFEDFRSATDYFAHPHTVEVTMEDTGNVRDLIHCGDPFVDQICAAFGVPKPFLLGSAMGTELATSRAQIDILMDTIQRRQFDMKRFIENQIFTPFCELHGFDEVPKVVWNPVDLRDLSEISNSLRLLVGGRYETPILTQRESREAIGKLVKVYPEDKPEPPMLPGHTMPTERKEEKRGG